MLAVIALVPALIIGRLAMLGWLTPIIGWLTPLDYGACLASHRVTHHTDRSYDCSPAMDFNGDLSLSCDWTPARDWQTTVCDRWQFPTGRTERDDVTH